MLNPAACIFFSIIALLIFIACHVVYRQGKRRTHISTLPFPDHCLQKLRQRHPGLRDTQIHEVELGLRQFFLTWHNSGFKFVSMPSQVVDDLWHEFILCTRDYARFCDQAFGRFLHHNPSGTMQASDKKMNEGLRRCWWHACKLEHIDPAQPTRLPALFELDARFNIQGGFHYAIKPVLPGATSAPVTSSPAAPTPSTAQDQASLLISGLALTMLPVAAFADKTIDGTLTGFGPKGESGCGGGCGGGGCGGCGGCGGE